MDHSCLEHVIAGQSRSRREERQFPSRAVAVSEHQPLPDENEALAN